MVDLTDSCELPIPYNTTEKLMTKRDDGCGTLSLTFCS